MSGGGLLSRAWRATGRLIAWANPLGFLDRRILRDHPLVWRFGFVHVIWYVALAWSTWWAIGRYMPVSPIDPPTTLTLAGIYSQLFLIVSTALAAWILSMMRHPLACASRGAIVATFMAIWAVAHLALTAPSAFTAAALPRVAALGDGWDFDTYAAALEPVNYGACFAPNSSGAQPDGIASASDVVGLLLGPSAASAARSAAARFDIRIDGGTDWCRGENGQRLCPYDMPACLHLSRGGSNLGVTALSDRMTTIRQARLHRDGDQRGQSEVLWPFSAASIILSLVVAAIAAGLTFRRSEPSRRDSARGDPLAPAFRVVSYAPGWLRRWDRALLRTHPAPWAMRAHMVALFATVAAALLVGLGAALFAYIDNVEDERIYLPFFITLCFAFGVAAAGLSAGYQKRFDPELDTPARVRWALLSGMAPFAPVGVATVVVAALEYLGRLDYDLTRYLAVPGILIFMGAVSGATVTFLARLFAWRPVVFVLVAICVINVSVFFFELDIFDSAMIRSMLALWIASLTASFALRFRAPATSRLLLLAAMIQTPWLCLFLGFLGAIEWFKPLGLPSDAEDLVATTVTMLGPVVIVGLLLRPLYPILVDMRVEPKEE